jgi:pantetheine-phosphate adenylyltransferase
MSKVLFAGSFDPFTIGHYSVYSRACDLFGSENVFIGVTRNPHKDLYGPKRLRWTINPISENVIIIPDRALVADFCQQNGISSLIRSMRNTTDFNYEMELANWNVRFGIETLFIPCKEGYEKISSSSVRTLAHFGKDVSEYLPEFTRTRWFTSPKRIIVAGFIGSGKSSYIDAFFREKYNCVDMDEVAKECLDSHMRADMRNQIINNNLNPDVFNEAGKILYDEILKMPKESIIEASALGTYTQFSGNVLRKLYDDSVIIRVDKFHFGKNRKIDQNFMKDVLRVQIKPLATDFIIDVRSQNIGKIEKINEEALFLLQS